MRVDVFYKNLFMAEYNFDRNYGGVVLQEGLMFRSMVNFTNAFFNYLNPLILKTFPNPYGIHT